VEPLSARRIRAWLDTLPYDTRERLFLLLEEVCAGVDLSRHNQFGFLRLRAELENSGELFGCTIAELPRRHRRQPRRPARDAPGAPTEPARGAPDRGRLARTP
jgi:hypothetical protein